MSKELNQKHVKRMQELVNAFKNGQNFVIHGNLSLSGCVELPDGFHRTPEYDGFIYESGFSDLFSKTPFIQKVLLQAKKTKKPLVLTEFGGYAFAPKDHVFNPYNEYGYKKFKSREELVLAVKELYERDIVPAIEKGLCGAIYTQLSDVEDETNGILSYDRKVLKIFSEIGKNSSGSILRTFRS